MKDLTLKFVYQNLTREEKEKTIELWTSSSVLNLTQAKERINQVSLIILRNMNIVGVSTVYIDDFTCPNNPYFFSRMFIKEDFRGSDKLIRNVMKLNFKNLKELYSETINGLVLELENEKFAKLGNETNYFQKKGYTYYGKSARGLQLWYVRFDQPKGIFISEETKEQNAK